jgi:hypothetical protein
MQLAIDWSERAYRLRTGSRRRSTRPIEVVESSSESITMVNRVATQHADAPVLRWLAWALVVALALGAVAVALVVLASPRGWLDVVSGRVEGWDGAETRASLTLRDGRWAGAVADFPPRSTTHFAPRGLPGFYLVRYPDGAFLALADRSPHRGQRVEWQNPRAGSQFSSNPGPKAGFNDGDSIFFADGFPETGPAPRPLDAFPLTVEAGYVYVAPYAPCPSYARGMRWCDSRQGNEEPPERCSEERPEYCWSMSRCKSPYGGHFCALPQR